MTRALSIHVRGVVQGVGFRPYVFRLARARALNGWVLNGDDGVRIHVEGSPGALDAFVADLSGDPPPAAVIADIEVAAVSTLAVRGFAIRDSRRAGAPTTRISPDLPVCESCLRELFDPADRRYRYPYINCTACGPRYSIVTGLPYDRPQTTMSAWAMCEACTAEYEDPLDRRFHAQPIACPICGPHVRLIGGGGTRGADSIEEAARLLREGRILAVKGVGGFHLACNARNAAAVDALRDRKFRKEKPFALMAPSLAAARDAICLDRDAAALLTSAARPIVIAGARVDLPGVAPGSAELGVMLPYTPLHYLLFEAGAPDLLVMTSANRSAEPIAYRDEEAFERLAGLADAFLVGERPIARRLDDSVVRAGAAGPAVVRRSRGYSPGVVARLPASRPILALGADLKNAVTLVVQGQAYGGQHVGDLDDGRAYEAFRETIRDLTSMYDVDWNDVLVVHDRHPQYVSARYADKLPAGERMGVQHHRAHIASVLAEREALDRRVLGVSFDGTGYGDDGSIWGGEFFVGGVRAGFERAAWLRPASLAGGDAAARHPVQAAAGFLAQLADLPNLAAPPFELPDRYRQARMLLDRRMRIFETTSAGRLFDAAAAVLGFTRPITFEGQAAIWLEQLARRAPSEEILDEAEAGNRELDWRPLLDSLVRRRARGADCAALARGFHRALAAGVAAMAERLMAAERLDTLVLSGGVFQNDTLVRDLRRRLDGVDIWTNQAVPPNDGGISLGQAALAAVGQE